MGDGKDILGDSNVVEECIALKKGSEKVEECKGNVVNKSEIALNGYEGMRKIQIEVNGEEKEIWLDDENLKVDSSFC